MIETLEGARIEGTLRVFAVVVAGIPVLCAFDSWNKCHIEIALMHLSNIDGMRDL